MRRFSEIDPSALRWLPTPGKDLAFDLLAGDDPIAHLAWTAGRSSLATGETADRKWTFKRVGFLNPHVTAFDSTSGKEVARLTLHWRTSLLQFAGRESYQLARRGVLFPTWEILDGGGRTMVHVEVVREGTRLSGGLVTVARDERTKPELPLLLLFGWHFVVLAWREEEAASGFEEAIVASVG